VQLLFGEAKTECAIDEEDVRKLGKLASAIPRHLAQSFILFSKTGTFSSEEVHFARSLNSEYERRVILWSREELEPYFLYERSANKLGQRRFCNHAH
jgi:cob(I)alamin adenosyltransferase